MVQGLLKGGVHMGDIDMHLIGQGGALVPYFSALASL
jgi:hypothetical protein